VGTLLRMSVWVVPLAFGSICGLLALATRLETQRVRVMVRMTVRSRTATPELAEALVAAELAPVLAAHGFQRR
jgi:hypothetical protein